MSRMKEHEEHDYVDQNSPTSTDPCSLEYIFREASSSNHACTHAVLIDSLKEKSSPE